GGMAAARIHVARSHAELADALRGLLREGDWVLVKGSRSMRMERVAEALGARERSWMFYHLLYPLASEVSAVDVFRYLTFRTFPVTWPALFLSFLVGPSLIRALARLRVGQPIREIGPAHQGKAGTPTMGGLLILLSLLVSVLLWSNLDSRAVWTVVGVTVGYG